MRNIVTVLLFLLCTSYAFARNQTIDVDNFLRTVDLKKIIYTDKAVNLHAQLSDPNASTTNVDDLNDFLAIGSKSTGIIDTLITEFDIQSNILAKKTYRLPWIGVGKFMQSEIPALKLQDGLSLVKSCIAIKMLRPAPEKIHRIVLYRTLQTHQIIYDYLFVMKTLPDGICQEILYTPDTGNCEMGMQTTCHAKADI